MTGTPTGVAAGRTAAAGAHAVRHSIRAAAAILRRDAGEQRFLGASFVLDLMFGVVNLVVFAVISRVLHAPGQQDLGGAASYFDFVAVGITFMLVVQAAGTQITSRVQEEQRSGTLEMLLAQPVRTTAIAVGISAYPMLFAVTRAVIYLAVAGMLLGLDLTSANWVGAAVVLTLGAAATMCLGILLAAFAVAIEHGVSVGRVAVVAIAFASGTYFPVTALPQALQWLSAPLPTRLALDGLRAALAGDGWGPAALWLLVAIAVGLPLAVYAFAAALRRAVRLGTVTRA